MLRLPLIIVALFLLTGAKNAANGAPNQDPPGFEEAAAICGALPFDSEKSRCLKEIRGKAFDTKAVAICRSQGFVSQKLDCLEIIGNRYYQSAAEINICKGMNFNSQQMDCLRQASHGAFPAEDPDTDSPEDLERQIAKAMKSIERGRSDKAHRILSDLLDDLRDEKKNPPRF